MFRNLSQLPTQSKIYFLLTLCLIFHFSWSQVPKKRLPRTINIPTKSHKNPTLSGDEKLMIYMSNYTVSGGFELMYAKQMHPEQWTKPEPVKRILKSNLDYLKGYFLSTDGNSFYFTSRRAPGIGGFDIWHSQRRGDNWESPQNLGKPINSFGNEGSPSLSADGKILYFMRCEKMDAQNADNCTLWVAEKKGNKWEEPQELPPPVNTGNEFNPQILADHQTLIFSSDRPEGKGGKDFYHTRYENGEWSEPLNMDFMNTDQDEEMISVPIRGDIAYYTITLKGEQLIIKSKIPEDFMPKKVMLFEGKVTDAATGGPANGFIQVYDAKSNKQLNTARTNAADGSFFIIIPEGHLYDFSIYPIDNKHTFYSGLYDLETMNNSERENLDISLKPLSTGTSQDLNCIRFKNYSDILKDESTLELRRLTRIMQKNPSLKIQVLAFVDSVYYDSIPSSPDLTETIVDTLLYEIEKPPLPELAMEDMDSNKDSLTLEDNLENLNKDSRNMEISELDSILNQGYYLLKQGEEKDLYYKIKTTYHNDRTQLQAQAVVDYLTNKGAPENRLSAVGMGDQWEKDKSAEERNYWLEIKIK